MKFYLILYYLTNIITSLKIPYYYNPNIHNLGNIGLGGVIHSNLALHSTKLIDKVRYDGRDMNKNFSKDKIKSVGWHMYMTPEQAAKGLDLLSKISKNNKDLGGSDNYKSLKSLVNVYNKF